MKKIYLLFLLLIPITVQAETIYTDYHNHLVDQTTRLETNDLIKEEEIKYYHFTKKKINEGYYELYNNPSNAPYYDIDDKIIVGKRERYNYQPNAIRGTLYSITNDFEVNCFEISGIGDIPKFIIYDINYQKINYEIVNHKVMLDKTLLLSNLIILFDFNSKINFNILINGILNFDIVFNDTTLAFNEINFVIDVLLKERLRNMGVYTSAHYEFFNYYINHIYHYKHYDLISEDIIKTTPDEGYDFITYKYNYYIRDKIIFADYLILSRDNQDLSKYIVETSIKDKIEIEENIDYEKNGVYEVTFKYQDLIISKYVYILNETKELEVKVIEKPVIQEKIIYQDILVPIEKECPKIICLSQIKEIEKIKYISKNVDCPSKINKEIAKDFNLAYVIPVAPIIIMIILFKKRKRNHQRT